MHRLISPPLDEPDRFDPLRPRTGSQTVAVASKDEHRHFTGIVALDGAVSAGAALLFPSHINHSYRTTFLIQVEWIAARGKSTTGHGGPVQVFSTTKQFRFADALKKGITFSTHGVYAASYKPCIITHRYAVAAVM